MSEKNNDQPVDKDLQISGAMEFQINFIEQPGGDMSFTVKASADRENTCVQYSMAAAALQKILEENKAEKDKNRKMKATNIQQYIDAANLLNRLAAILADKVYREGMKRSDVRLTQTVPTDDIVN